MMKLEICWYHYQVYTTFTITPLGPAKREATALLQKRTYPSTTSCSTSTSTSTTTVTKTATASVTVTSAGTTATVCHDPANSLRLENRRFMGLLYEYHMLTIIPDSHGNHNEHDLRDWYCNDHVSLFASHSSGKKHYIDCAARPIFTPIITVTPTITVTDTSITIVLTTVTTDVAT